MAFLTPAQIEKQQAESEGYQQGPQPEINNPNANTQDALGNTVVQTPVPAPYYPGATETPNLRLSLTNMPVNIAENFVILDTPAIGPQLPVNTSSITSKFFNAYNSSTGVFSVSQPAFTDISGTISFSQAPPGGSASTFWRGDGVWATPAGASQASTLKLAPIVLSGGTDAINPHTPATYVVTTPGVDAMTLAAPTVTTDDGVVIKVTIGTDAAHTITFTGGTLQPGTAAVTTANFASFAGSSIELMAYQGAWFVMAQNNIASYT